MKKMRKGVKGAKKNVNKKLNSSSSSSSSDSSSDSSSSSSSSSSSNQGPRKYSSSSSSSSKSTISSLSRGKKKKVGPLKSLQKGIQNAKSDYADMKDELVIKTQGLQIQAGGMLKPVQNSIDSAQQSAKADYKDIKLDLAIKTQEILQPAPLLLPTQYSSSSDSEPFRTTLLPKMLRPTPRQKLLEKELQREKKRHRKEVARRAVDKVRDIPGQISSSLFLHQNLNKIPFVDFLYKTARGKTDMNELSVYWVCEEVIILTVLFLLFLQNQTSILIFLHYFINSLNNLIFHTFNPCTIRRCCWSP